MRIDAAVRKLKNFKLAPFLKVHALIYWAVVLGQFTCGYTLGIAGTALTWRKLSWALVQLGWACWGPGP